MIIDCIADLHGYYPKLEGGDLLIVAGDLTARDQASQYIEFYKWLKKQPYRKKIIVPGNHDNYFQECNTFSSAPFSEELATYLCDSGIEFEGLHIWGSPWTLKFDGMNPKCMAFTCDIEKDLAGKWALIPDDIDILISHTPFLYMLDQNTDGQSCGSYELRNVVDRVKPKLFVCGHIHEQGGQTMLYKHLGPNTICVNCSLVNERYKPVNKPIRVIL